MFVIFGILAALYERNSSGLGQVVDAAIVVGVAALLSLFYSLDATGNWTQQRECNVLDGGAPFYNTFETSDEKLVAVGPI